MLEDLRPFRCPSCHSDRLEATSAGLTCSTCQQQYASQHGILDFLPTPSDAVVQELVGLAAENSVDIRDGMQPVKLLKSTHIETMTELMAKSRFDPTQYYQQTSAAFYEGLARARPDSGLRVLEIGSERTFFKLRTIKDLCSEAYALNIFFHVTPANEGLDWPIRLLGDMNDLPFQDNYLDLIICSASLHHTGTIDTALAEMRRVLRSGGRVLLLNEPVEGCIKAWGSKRGLSRHTRHEEIHEDPVTMRQWTTAIANSGMSPDYFLPAWFFQQLGRSTSLPDGVRFRRAALIIGPFLSKPVLQDLARIVFRLPGQAILGLPLNAVLWKTPTDALNSASAAECPIDLRRVPVIAAPT